jgi:hypothetical protein
VSSLKTFLHCMMTVSKNISNNIIAPVTMVPISIGRLLLFPVLAA